MGARAFLQALPHERESILGSGMVRYQMPLSRQGLINFLVASRLQSLGLGTYCVDAYV